MIHNLIVGAMSVLMAYAMFTHDEEELEQEAVQDEPESDVVINGRRFHQMSCQTCRKIKNHREVEPRIFECVKCHRRVNLNSAS